MNASVFLNLLVNTIIGNYFQNSNCIFIFKENTSSLQYNGSLPMVIISIQNNNLRDDLIFQNYGCQGFVIQHRNASTIITEIEKRIKVHQERFNFRRYLIIPAVADPRDLYRIFTLDELEFIADLLVIIPMEVQSTKKEYKILWNVTEIYRLITHKYVGNEDQKASRILDTWFSQNRSFLEGNSLYPNKLLDQEGKILRCATFEYKPYVVLDNSLETAMGSEHCVINEYAKIHNMTINYVLDDYEWGEIYSNWTGKGILGNLASDKADVGFAALYTWEHEYAFLDFTTVVTKTGVTCLVPAPRLAAGWLTPFFPFSLSTWIGSVIVFEAIYLTVLFISWFLLKYSLTKSTNQAVEYLETHVVLIRIFLIQSAPSKLNQPLKKALRYMFMIFLYALLLGAFYSSGLASVMTVPRYESTIQTALDLAESGLHWGATQDAWLFSIKKEQRPQYITLMKQFVAETPENLTKRIKSNNFAFSLERLPSGQYAIGSYITEDSVENLRLMKEDLYTEYCVFMLRKSSPILNSLNKLILRLVETGMLNYWEMMAARTHMNLRIQNIVHYYATTSQERRDDVVKLKWMHVEGAFAILVCGYILGALCFLLENIIYKYNYRNVRQFML